MISGLFYFHDFTAEAQRTQRINVGLMVFDSFHVSVTAKVTDTSKELQDI